MAFKNRSHTESYPPTKEYRTWARIKSRCYWKRNPSYDRYGGRGIIVCDRWVKSYENFLSDMGRAPSKNHSIDRIDVNGNYEPSNCKWSTIIEQCNNKSNNRLIEIDGETMSLGSWAKKLGVSDHYLWIRIERGLPVNHIFLNTKHTKCKTNITSMILSQKRS